MEFEDVSHLSLYHGDDHTLIKLTFKLIQN